MGLLSQQAADCAALVGAPIPPNISTCIGNNPAEDDVTPKMLGCLLGLFPNDYAQLGGCLLDGSINTATVLSCANKVTELRPRVALAGCLTSSPKDVLKRCAPAIPDLQPAATCLVGNVSNPAACIPVGNTPALNCARTFSSDSTAFAACLVRSQVAGGDHVLNVLLCMSRSTELVDIVASCFADRVPEQIRRILACALKQNTKSGLLTCAASGVLTDDEKKILACAASGEGSYANVAICIFGFKINKEWQIAARCIAQSGGNVFAAAGCTGGLLTQRELNKCLKGGIGTEDGCFGPNNTIRVFLGNTINDLLLGPTDSNEAVKAYHAAEAALGAAGQAVVGAVSHLDDCKSTWASFRRCVGL
jgi:hypothetical protein